MADYFEPTVIQQTIPDEDMTPIERLLLTRMFECERHDKGWYLFAEDRPSTIVFALRDEVERALAATSDTRSTAFTSVSELITTIDPETTEITLDLGSTSWEVFLQDIVKRSKTLRYLTAVTAFTCSKVRPDGFGGMAVVITADSIIGKSTNDFIEDVLTEDRLEKPATRARKRTVLSTTRARHDRDRNLPARVKPIRSTPSARTATRSRDPRLSSTNVQRTT